MSNTIVTLWKGNSQVTAYVTIRQWNGDDWEDIIENAGYLVFTDDLYDDFEIEQMEETGEEYLDFWDRFVEYVLADVSAKTGITFEDYEVNQNF